MNKRVFRVLIFALGTMMLLLRPYMIYQLTQKKAQANNPVKVYSLLQRLVKKKDEHHELTEVTATVNQRSKFSFQLPIAWVKAFLACIGALLCFLYTKVIRTSVFSAFQIRPENHQYRLISSFRI
jgi:hypothetical protein